MQYYVVVVVYIWFTMDYRWSFMMYIIIIVHIYLSYAMIYMYLRKPSKAFENLRKSSKMFYEFSIGIRIKYILM